MSDFLSCGWLWLYAGAFVMLLELATPGFVMFFFGLSAATVGLLCFIFGDAFSSAWQLGAFSVLTVVYLTILRRLLKSLFSGDVSKGQVGEFVGRVGRVTEAINPPRTGRVMIGDAEWDATADGPLAVDTHVKVILQQNLTMKVEELI